MRAICKVTLSGGEKRRLPVIEIVSATLVVKSKRDWIFQLSTRLISKESSYFWLTSEQLRFIRCRAAFLQLNGACVCLVQRSDGKWIVKSGSLIALITQSTILVGFVWGLYALRIILLFGNKVERETQSCLTAERWKLQIRAGAHSWAN